MKFKKNNYYNIRHNYFLTSIPLSVFAMEQTDNVVPDVITSSSISSVTATNDVYGKPTDEMTANSIKEILSRPKKNINFIKGSYDNISHLEYTYTSDNKDYKIIENTSADGKNVDSAIYQKNEVNEYEQFAKLTVNSLEML